MLKEETKKHETVAEVFESERIKHEHQIIDEYLSTQIELLEETIEECNQEVLKAPATYSPRTDEWRKEADKAAQRLIFLRELQRRERNGL